LSVGARNLLVKGKLTRSMGTEKEKLSEREASDGRKVKKEQKKRIYPTEGSQVLKL